MPHVLERGGGYRPMPRVVWWRGEGHVALKQRAGVCGSGALFMLSVPFCRSYLMKVWTSTCHSSC